MDVPTPASLCVHFPVKMSMWPPTRPSFDRRDQMAFAARSASCLNWLSPVRWLRMPNSRASVPAQAVDVTWLSFPGTPYLRFADPNGMPVGVSKAGSMRRARSSARSSSSSSYSSSSNPSASSVARRCADSRPPSTRMLVSNTETVLFRLKLRFSATHLTCRANSVRLPSTTSVSRASTNVSE